MSWLHEKTTDFLKQVREAKEKKAFPFLRRFENVGPRVKIGRGSYINFTSNDYLGLSQHPALIQAAMAATARFGTGLGSSRLQATADRHDELERRLARWLGYPACAVFTTGYQSLVGTIATFLDGETTVILDNYSHASILDGVFLAKGNHPNLEVRFFKHNSVRGLRRVLQSSTRKQKLVIVEGLYSVDGDMAPLAEMVEVCKEYGAPIMVDDAHGLGTIGRQGRGVGELLGVLDQIDFLVGTFSKSFGGVGGYVAADQTLIDYLKLQARSFVYSASLPVAQVDAAIAALDIIETDPSYRDRLETNKRFFREGLLELGFDLGVSNTHITPIMIGDDVQALTFGAYLYHGAKVIMLPFIYPGVPKGTARLRCNVTAAHSKADMGYALEALGVIGQELGILKAGAKTRASSVQKALWLAEGKVAGLKNAGLGYLVQELEEAGSKVSSWAEGLFGGRGHGAKVRSGNGHGGDDDGPRDDAAASAQDAGAGEGRDAAPTPAARPTTTTAASSEQVQS
ncbi:MAG: aminotransferase class I/II-fold pyridoxal phosphate-dependent enzyme [Deltaproteobacteria bacterium]|nr:aminotransferase class I/II-fold pyridoxal phosphate-dependent enzyme [Deltaproteobacteria bacterium]